MSVFMIARVALKALGRNKLRTALTMLGMIIGVGAVITMVALGKGAEAQIEEQIRGAGTNMITINPGSSNTGGVKMGGGTARLVPDDAKALRQLAEVAFVTEGIQSRQQIVYSNQNWSTNIVGINVDYQNIKSWPTIYGGFFTEYDVQTAAKVCVLGLNVATNLFGEGIDPTGAEIRVRNHLFKVLGVMGPKGASSSGQNQDDMVFAPYTTVMKKLQGNDWLNYILVAPANADGIPRAVAAITAELRLRHEIDPGEDDDFRVQTQEDMIAARTQTSRTMTSLLAGIAAVSLIVGGIGIMNIMLVSVTERTREIGLRLAIGARSSDVLMQFLVEAVVISLVGGAIGIGVGILAAEGVSSSLQTPTVIPANAVGIAVGFSAAVGIFFGFYPAQKASALDPIEALRFE